MIIPVQMSKGQINVFSIIINKATDETLSLAKKEDKCTTGAEKSLCPVITNEIIGLNVGGYAADKYNFAWVLDGKRIAPEADPTTAYFPVTAEKGQLHNMRVDIVGSQPDNATQKISLLRSFTVTEPATTMKLVGTDGDSKEENGIDDIAPLLLGYYVDKDAAKQWPNYSKDIFQAMAGKIIQLQPQNNTSDMGKTTWTVDGKTVLDETEYASDPYLTTVDGIETLNIPIEKALGTSYKVTSVTPYAQTMETKRVLYDRWQISTPTLATKDIANNFTIQVADKLNEATVVASKIDRTKVLASLFSGLPSYIAFLFKIMVTFVLILFSSSLLLSFSPDKETTKKNYSL